MLKNAGACSVLSVRLPVWNIWSGDVVYLAGLIHKLRPDKLLRAALLCSSVAVAAPPPLPPHLDENGQADYREYLGARDHRAFAIAPGGAWGWKAEAGARAEAEEGAISACQANTQQKCVLYTADGKLVLDTRKWTQLWGPYAGTAAARKAPNGNQLGDRFPDVAYVDAKGRTLSVTGLSSKVAVLHFWGSWCGPCRREMPDMQNLYEALKDRRDIVFVLMQVREPFAVSRRWAETRGIHLPLYDSGAEGELDASFRLADGARIGDREIASRFPTTYVIDKRGIVVFAHIGSVSDWKQYRDFLLDAARRSGR